MKHRWQNIRHGSTVPTNKITITRLQSTVSCFGGVTRFGVNLLVFWEGMCCLIQLWRLWHTYIFKFELPFCFLRMTHRWQNKMLGARGLQSGGGNRHRRRGNMQNYCHLYAFTPELDSLERSGTNYNTPIATYRIVNVWTNQRTVRFRWSRWVLAVRYGVVCCICLNGIRIPVVSQLVSMDFDLMLWNESRRLRTKLHLHVILAYEWCAYYAEWN
jgi:hypothetical protein